MTKISASLFAVGLVIDPTVGPYSAALMMFVSYSTLTLIEHIGCRIAKRHGYIG